MNKLQELQEKRAHISEQLMELANGEMTTEQRTQYDALAKEADDLGGDISRMQKAEDLQKEMARRSKPPRGPVGGAEDPEAEARERKLFESRQDAAFTHYMRTGQVVGDFLKRDSEAMAELPKELRDLGLASATASNATAVFVPQGFVQKIEEALLAYGDIIPAVSSMETSTGAPLPFPTDDDTANIAEIVGEGVQVASADPTISNITMGAFKYSTKLVKVSMELAQDSAFPMDSYVAGKFGTRLARKLTSDITIGAGTTLPYGLVTRATAGKTADGSATNTGGSETGTTTIGSQDLRSLIHSVDPSYRQGAKFVMHDTTVELLENVLDKYGRPLFTPNIQTGKLESLFGYPIVIDQYMATVQASAKSVLFGDLSKYVLRKVKGLTVLRLTERFADYGQIGFLGFARYDGDLLDAGTHPVKYLIQHA